MIADNSQGALNDGLRYNTVMLRFSTANDK